MKKSGPPKSTFKVSKAYKRTLLQSLAKAYPNAASELTFKNEYQLVTAVILSAQCTDKKVNEVTPALFKQYPTFPALAGAKVSAIEKLIRPVNYYKTKARNIVAMAQEVLANFSGTLPETILKLQTLSGVGRKTANVVLTEIGKVPALPVDTHVFRVAHRLGLANGSTPARVEEELKEHFASRYWRRLHHWLIWHGRRRCKAIRPNCPECPLNQLCPRIGTVRLGRKT